MPASDVNPYAPPQFPVGPALASPSSQAIGVRTARGIEVPNRSVFPDCCVKCGTRNDLIRWPRTFQWTPQWVYFLILANLIVLAVVAMIVRKVGTVELGICAACQERWKRGTVLMWLGVLWLVTALIGGITLAAVSNSGAVAAFGVLIALSGIVVPVLIGRRIVRPATLTCTYATKTSVTLRGFDPTAERVLTGELA